MTIDTDLDGGSIVVVDDARPSDIELLLRPDTANESFKQWFHFRHRGAKGKPSKYRVGNVGSATFPDAFEGYRAAASYDLDRWFRVPTEFDGESLTFRHTPANDDVHYAYFAPYSVARREQVLARAAKKRHARVEEIGRSVEGRPIHMVVVGDEEEEDRLRIWIGARQHPGETMAEWFAEGALARLLDGGDELAKAVLSRALVYIVPCVNPDGGVLGNLRTNARGRDLNRSWADPSEDDTPEVFAMRAKMIETGVDLFLDVHGDERNPYIFAAGCEGNPGYSERLDALEDLFMGSLVELDGDFQREYGYDRDDPGAGDLSAAANWVGETFDCLSLTLEMPFKDNANHPDARAGWSPERAKHLGRTALESAYVCLDSLR